MLIESLSDQIALELVYNIYSIWILLLSSFPCALLFYAASLLRGSAQMHAYDLNILGAAVLVNYLECVVSTSSICICVFFYYSFALSKKIFFSKYCYNCIRIRTVIKTEPVPIYFVHQSTVSTNMHALT
jgi:hypothetical protein